MTETPSLANLQSEVFNLQCLTHADLRIPLLRLRSRLRAYWSVPEPSIECPVAWAPGRSSVGFPLPARPGGGAGNRFLQTWPALRWRLPRRRVRLPLSPLQQLLADRLDPTPVRERRARRRVTGRRRRCVAPDPDSVLLIRRADRVGDPWSGHMGSARWPIRADDARPAEPPPSGRLGRRSRSRSTRAILLGVLDDVSPRTPIPRPVVVRPFIFAIDGRPALQPNDEVALVLWVPLTS